MKALRWSLVALAAVAAIIGVTAALNREVPVALELLPPSLLQQARWKHPATRAWRELRYEAEKTMVPSGGSAIEATVRYRVENLGNGIVRSTDSWYPRAPGQALVYEERYLNAGNLFSLLVRYREPAPAFHAIFENEGWFESRVIAMGLEEGPGLPGAPGWFQRGSLERLEDIVPSVGPTPTTKRLHRKFECRSVEDRSASPSGRPVVACEIDDGDRGTRRRKLVYLQEAAVFVPVEVDQRSSEGSLKQGLPRKLTLDGADISL